MSPRNLILPVETLNREFDARVLQGLIAVNRGWTVVIGSKALINRNIWRFPPSVYLCQTLTSNRITMLKYLRDLGFSSVGWCEEGFVYPGKDLYLKRRIDTSSLQLLTALVAWGENNNADLQIKTKETDLQPLPLGNPRIDLLRPEFRKLYVTEVNKLKDRFGDYLLFNSNFANVNPAPELRNRRFNKNTDPDLARQYNGFVEYRRKIFHEFQRVLPAISEKFADKKIIIRPHPSENPKFWNSFMERHSNIEVVRENTAIPWLLGAKAIIHNVCTTAAEAALLGKPAISYCPIMETEHEHVLSNEISIKAVTPDKLIERIVESVDQELSLGADQEKRLDHFVASRTGDLASVRIQNLFEEVTEFNTQNGNSSAKSLLTRGITFSRYCYKSMRIGHKTDRYIPTVFPNVDVDYVEDRSNAIRACLNMNNSYKIKKIAQNIFQFSPN